jgi:nickel superoxide dismutase
MLRATLAAATALLILAPAGQARAHCQIPCGIYDDHTRVHLMREDVTTIVKSLKELAALTGKTDVQSVNQAVRWVINKDAHAEKIIRTISDYFLTQKLPPPPAADKKAYGAYLEKLARHHAVMVAAMKCKQSGKLDAVKPLEKALDGIDGYWPAGKK